MIKKMLNFTMLLIMFLTFSIDVFADETVDLAEYFGSTGTITTYSDETVDLGSHFGSSGATYTDGDYYYGFDKNFTDTLITNQFHVISGYESPTPPNDVVYISSSYFQFTNFGSQCGDSNFSFSNFVEIDYEFYNFIDKISSVYYNDTACAITSRTENRLYFSCTAPYVSNSQLYIYYDRIPSYPTYSAPVSIGRIVSVSCPSQNQVIIDQNNQIITNGTETNDKLDDLNDNITSEEMPDTSEYGDVSGWLPSGTIDTLINLPLTMLNAINDNANKSCSPYQLPFINNTTISIPCIGSYLESLSGWGTLISIIDMCIAAFLLYKLLMSLYKDIQKILSLNQSDSDLGGIE